MPSLSRRGRELADSPPLPEYIAEHFARAGEPWHADENPDGYVGMCLAENKLLNARLAAQLAQYSSAATALGYDAMTGNLEFRQELARFMGRTFLGREFPPAELAVLAGAGSVLELLFHVICDAGDAVLVPTPSYAGFWADLETRDELRIVTVDCASDDDFRLTSDALDAAFARAERPVRALLFTTPNNPLGRIYSREEILEVVNWTRAKGIHLVVDEIYALSVFGERAFVSAASLVPTLGDDIHIVWAFSKDFGASGLRCGVLVSENPSVLNAVGGLGYWAACSTHTQSLLNALITDEKVVDDYLAAMQRSLREAYNRVTRCLDAEGIAYVPAEAAFFLLIDLRSHLATPTWEAERVLWRQLLEQANVNLTPGEACRINEPGFFRLCYAGESTAAVEAGIARMGAILAA